MRPALRDPFRAVPTDPVDIGGWQSRMRSHLVEGCGGLWLCLEPQRDQGKFPDGPSPKEDKQLANLALRKIEASFPAVIRGA